MQCLINGVEYEAKRDFYIVEKSGNKTESKISVLVEDQPIPVSGDIIELTDGGETLFWGTCGIPKSPKYQTGLELSLYTITCGNANSILSNRIINVAYQNVTITAIIQDLFDNYISAENITLGAISNIPLTMEVYTAADFNLQSALNELADLVGATWQVTSDHIFSFVVAEDFPVFPLTINNEFLLGTDLQHTTKSYKTRTVQYISGAKDTTLPQTETFSYTGEETSFTVSFPVSSRPTILVNGVAVPTDQVGVTGLDTNTAFLFSYSSQVIKYTESSEYLKIGDTVTITYTGIFPIRISASNEEKIAQIAQLTGTSGLREVVKIDTSIETTNDALTVANQLLEQYSEATGELSLWLLSSQLYAADLTLSDTEVLTQVNFDLPQLGITGPFVITERKLEPFNADLTNFHEALKITLKLMNRDYLKSYGETISDLRSDISRLSIRGTEVVVQAPTFREVLALSESMKYDTDIVYYITGSPTPVNGSMFAPLDFGLPVYPTQGGPN